MTPRSFYGYNSLTSTVEMTYIFFTCGIFGIYVFIFRYINCQITASGYTEPKDYLKYMG